jgi:SAM-dependent methyltransferase
VRLAEIYRLEAIPVQSCVLLESREEAMRFSKRELVLVVCDDCGFLFNAVFEPEMVDYASTTEESQHFSGTFNRFACELVGDIAATFDLRGRRTLEIGCGKGDFLKELVQATGTIGLGVDPGFIPQRLAFDDRASIAFRRECFNPSTIDVAPDFVVCRHTLEHIDDVGRFMADVAAVTGGRKEVDVFFETPDVARVLAEGAFWDIYYEHCSYFTLGSHARLFHRAGFDVTRLYLAYDDQYIIQYAQPGERGTPLAVEHDLERVRALAAAFPARVEEVRAGWIEFIGSRRAAGRRIAIWGGGSKGVSFITTNGAENQIAHVVDVNPHKQGKYLPGAGNEVIAPEALVDEPPDTVIVMNPVYLAEIRAQLASLGLDPEVVAV